MMKKRLALLALVMAVLTTGSMLVGFIPINQTTTTSTATTAPTTTTTTTTTATTKSNVNLRKTASTSATKLTTISKGKTVTIIEKSGDWYKVTYGSYTGYVMGTYLSIGSGSSGGSDTSASGTATTTTSVILRASASTSSKKLLTVAKSKTVTIVGKSGDWYKVTYSSKTGYIMAKYLKVGGSSSGGTTGPSAALGKTGHIKIPNTKVDYDIMLATDNSYYLTRNEKGVKSVNGSIFMDYRNRDSSRQRNIITYGHNMKSGAMYRTLHSFNTNSFMTTNQDITVELFGTKYKYRIFAAGDYKIASFKYRTQFDNTADFMSYINDVIIKGADVTTGWKSNGAQDILTMSTCINDSSRRWIVFAYRVGTI